MTTVRIILALVAALILSAALNVHLFNALASARAAQATADKFATEVARAQGRADAYAETYQRTNLLADLAQLDQAQLLRDLRDMTERSRERVTIYRDRITTLPAPTCAPGAERMAAVNALLEVEP